MLYRVHNLHKIPYKSRVLLITAGLFILLIFVSLQLKQFYKTFETVY